MQRKGTRTRSRRLSYPKTIFLRGI